MYSNLQLLLILNKADKQMKAIRTRKLKIETLKLIRDLNE